MTRESFFETAADIIYGSMREGVRKDAEQRASIVPLMPWAIDCEPWSGPKQSPADKGYLYATEGARGSTVLWFDRACTQFAETHYAPRTVGNVHQLAGRLWKIRRLEPTGPEAA